MMKPINYGIIGGTGAFTSRRLGDDPQPSECEIKTKYGTVMITLLEIAGERVALLKRHGTNHSAAPHQINYRANIMALKSLGVKKVLATAAVGSLKKEIQPGELVLLADFIDFTWGRPVTIFDGPEDPVVHVDMTTPYCPTLRNTLTKAIADNAASFALHNAVYVCTQGPRFETPAEIAMYHRLGADVVGMTTVPEVILAREAELCYSSVGIVTNYASGVSQGALTHKEVLDVMAASSEKVKALFETVIGLPFDEKPCSCTYAVRGQVNLGG